MPSKHSNMVSGTSYIVSMLPCCLEGYSTIAHSLLVMLAVTVAHYAVTTILLSKAVRDESHLKIPPVVPHYIPFFGSIPWQYVWSPIEFLTSSYYTLLQHPVRLRLFTRDFYIIQRREHVVAHLAQTSTSNTIFNATFLRQACAMSDEAVARMGSEAETTPKYFERKYLAAAPLFAWSSYVVHRYLAGRNALLLLQRFKKNLHNRIAANAALAQPEGFMIDKFLDFFIHDVTAALLDAMCGKGLLERNPTFTGAFWTFCDNLPTFMKRTPRFLAPRAIQAREEVLAAVADWHMWASESFDEKVTLLDADGDDPFWGSKFFRERFSAFIHDLGFEARDMASMDLGFLFGASANVTVNTYWCAIDVFKDKVLLEDIRREVQGCKVDGDGDRSFDISKLIQQPILQAVFAESLRLRCHNMFIRKTTANPHPRLVYAHTWVRAHLLRLPSTGHMDSKVWSNTTNSHPVDAFWPGRFLKYTDDSETPRFFLVGTEGSWLPSGSGANLCPGRHFTKIHCIVTLAMMVESFDCDILAEPKDLKLDLSKFGMGVLGPSGKVGARLRRGGLSINRES
ncbi:cytochrome P450 [Ophiobolus disseminans]|uniref:Cytochrome P450 n=1 Tax=Ophiobolus disseminans TaxID=1469910 RepID=A0A6A6ZLK8_9PLEO|nr:cytochrome P450 [Ophiobolus disseminans]